MKKLFALILAFAVSSVVADQTANVLTNTWSGAVNYTGAGGGTSGGNVPGYNASTNTLYFGYTQATVGQTIAINNALQGSGVQVGGINYGFAYRNEPGAGGTLSTIVNVLSNAGVVLHSYNHALPYGATGWQNFDQTQTFNTQYGLANLGNASMTITGKDNRFWAGYYGPQVKDPYLTFTYTADPCIANPAYSPSCANYNTVNISGNLVPNPSGYAVSGSSLNQSYAINQALSLSGSNVLIHGFQWGYVANANGPYCGSWDLGIFGCLDPRTPSVTTNVNITDNNNSNLYSISRTYQNSYNTTNYSYLFPSSRNLLTLGNFNFTATTNDQAYVGDVWSKALYTPDPCVVNPLSSTSCPGYAQAYLEQQCTANPLYSTTCSGYAVAYFNQQCSANALYNAACPGYAAAYLNYQCSINPLYATQCPGYETAYFNQQCSIDPLYNKNCTGYGQAYFKQQCSINPLYNVECEGYAAAYKSQQCSINALYATDCPGYAAAYFTQQCNLNGLYSTQCPNYAEAYAKKMVLEQQGMASTVATAGVIAQTAPAPTTTTVSNDGTVSTSVSKTGDTNVDKAIAAPAPTTNAAAAPAAPVQLVQPPPSPAAPAGPSPQQAEKKPEGGQQQAQGPQPQGGQGDKPQQPTARQQLAERRAEAAKREAVEKGKNLANEMGKAADMEAQKQIQNVVIQAMGFTPGFDSYSKATVPDAVGYRPFTVYANQVNVDNRRVGQGLFGPADRLHNEIVNSQYNRGK